MTATRTTDKKVRARALMGLATEDRLIILSCVPESCDQRDSDITAVLRQTLDWQYMVRASIEHLVAPLLYRRLNHTREVNPEVFIPPTVLDDLHQLYACSKARNERMFKAIATLFRRFEHGNVEAIALKDLSLAYGVFAEPALRPMGDIDILIRQQQYAQARECLQHVGFEPLPGPDNALTMKYAWGHHFRREQDNLWVDLQWNILQREWTARRNERQFDIDEMWAASRPIEIDGATALRPCPEHMLFHLCLHLEGHRYSELILFVEIAELLGKHKDMDWDAFLAIARQCGAERSVYQVLSFAVTLLQAPVPATVLAQLQSSTSITASLQPLFAPLSRLHMQLDEVRLAAAPSAEVMDRMEATVRRHAAAATHVSRELERLACTPPLNESSVFLIKCEPSERLFADTALNAFGKITALTLESNMPRVMEALEELGYEREEQNIGRWRKVAHLTCPDPVSAASFQLEFHVTLANDPDQILREFPATGISPRAAALELLRTRLGTGERDIERIPVHMRIVPLPVETLATYLIAEVGRSSRDRMFAISNILEVLRRCERALDWKQMLRCARRYGLDEAFRRGLKLVRTFAEEPFACDAEADTPGEYVLSSARHDHAADAHAAFKRAFFCIWVFAASSGTKAKLRYAVHAALGARGQESILRGLIAELGRTVLSLTRRRAPMPVFTYWVEPNVLARLTSIRSPR